MTRTRDTLKPSSGAEARKRRERVRCSGVARRTRIGSWRVFERRFQPIARQDGSFLWERVELPSDLDAREWWTVVDCEGKLYVSPGFRFVNRFGYVRCAVPWRDDDQRQPDYRYD